MRFAIDERENRRTTPGHNRLMFINCSRRLGVKLAAILLCFTLIHPPALMAAGGGGTDGSGPAPTQVPEPTVAEPSEGSGPAASADRATGNGLSTDVAMLLPGLACPGYAVLDVDHLPAEVYVDGHVMALTDVGRVIPLAPGKHFVSLYPPQKVYVAFRNDAPEQFWDGLRPTVALGDEHSLMSSYERGAVRVGTQWVYAVADDTVGVRLSRGDALKTYRRDSACVLNTFLVWMVLIGAGMVASIKLATLK